MKNMKAKLAALEAMSSRGMGMGEKEMPAHDVKCPKCGYEWTMGEDEYEDDMESEDSED